MLKSIYYYIEKFEDFNICLIHSRLSIIDLHDRSNQPMKFKNYVLVFNGEIYNYVELKKILEKKNYKFETNSDTEVLIQAYKKWGTECVKKFDGMWSFCIYNTECESHEFFYSLIYIDFIYANFDTMS